MDEAGTVFEAAGIVIILAEEIAGVKSAVL